MENNSSRKRQLTSNSNKVGVTNAKKLKKKKNQEMAVLPASSTPAKELNASNSQNMDSFSSINMTPRHLLVTDAIASREFEIRAMEKAISNATEHTGAIRIFQIIPRYQRRRAASYNIKRLPKYIRDRAQAQMDKDPESPKKGQTRRQKRLPSRLASFKMKAGSWLETHLWHVKRMKMMESHGCKIALEPNQKSSRSLFRAACHESVIHDASYEKIIQIEGDRSTILRTLECISDPLMTSFAAKHHVNGTKSSTIFLHEVNQYPLNAVAKVTFLWQQNKNESNISKLWIWAPLGTEADLMTLLKTAFSFTAKKYSFNDSNINISLIPDMIKFQLFGPRSHAILASCLQLIECNTSSKQDYLASHELWEKLILLESSTLIPEGAVLGLEIEDPRLSFPVLMEKRLASSDFTVDSELISILSNWPSNVAQSSIWNEKVREASVSKRPTTSSIYNRRSEQILTNRVKFDPAVDTMLPIILIHRMNNTKSHMASGWELIAPRGWSQLLLNTFVYAGIRVAGVNNIKSFYLEAGLPYFPSDFPECPVHHLEAKIHEREFEKKFNRAPKAKRFNFENAKWKSPFRPAFEALHTDFSRKKLFVLHSDRVVKILGEELVAGHANFESFSQTCLSKIQKLVSQRSYCNEMENISTQTIKKSLVRVLLDLPIGRIGPNSKIHRTFDEVLKVDSVVRDELVIGFTSCGGYSLAKGKSCAIGCCTLEGIYSAYKFSERGLFVRSPTSRLSRFCTFKLIC